MCRQAIALITAVMLPATFAAGAATADFTEETQFGTRATIPVALADYDGDLDLDVAVGNFNQPNHLFINLGGGNWSEEPQFGTGQTFAIAWADYDNDGDQDAAVGRGSNQQNWLYVNNGDLSFTQVAQFGLGRTNALSWADYDADGDLDMAVGNGLLGAAAQNLLYVNNGDDTFTGQGEFGVGQSATLMWGDADGDGDLDLAVGNGGFGSVGQNRLYVNNGDGTFAGQDEFGSGDTASLDWGDTDDDGDLDLAVGNWNNGQDLLYRNDGALTFVEQPVFGARDANTVSLGDADNDGDLDLAVGNGDFVSADANYLYVNDGSGAFTEVPAFGLGSTDGVAWGDIDGDGDLDLVAGNEHSPTQNYLYVNNENDADYLKLDLVGQFHVQGAGFSNRDAIGARIAVYESGFLGDPAHLLGFREVAAHGGFASQDARQVHFGLPGQTTVDVRTTWPGSAGSNLVQDVQDVQVGIRLTIVEGVQPTHVEVGSAPPARGIYFRAAPNPTASTTELELGGPGVTTEVGIYNVTGRLIRTLEMVGPDGGGSYRVVWDGRAADGRPVPAGVYLVSPAGTERAAGRVVRLR